jgi:NodT family efflux transporter outer membrane factor (OMF) lipoprotein
LLLASACITLAGCASYSGIAPQARTAAMDSLNGNPVDVAYRDWPAEDWFRALLDPVLTGLIEQAFENSPNLQAARARLDRAAAVAGQAESALYPQLGVSASTTRERFSEHGQTPAPYAGTTQSINDLQVSGQWELDFFGKNRETLRAAIGEYRASEAEFRATRQLLANDIARVYFTLARLRAERAIVERRQEQRGDLLRLVQRRFEAGIDTRVELEVAQGVMPEIARDLAALDEQTALTRHTLAALIGAGPEAVNAVAPTLPAVASLALPQSVPADLLGHRADVVAARWRVESALHGLAATKALFYPNINLRGFAGLSAIGFDNWLDIGSRQPGLGIAVTLPLFDAGRLRNQYRASAASVDSAVASYNGTLLDALHDVADQLSTLTHLETQLARQDEVVASAMRSYDLALKRYKADIADRLTVLNVESNLINQRRLAVDLQARWIDSRIRLVRALGGGFTETQSGGPALAAILAPTLAPISAPAPD